MNRRDFLALRTGQPAELSCERLYMRFLDAQAEGTTTQLFDRLAAELRAASVVHLTETAWLSNGELRSHLDDVLAGFKAAGGRIDGDYVVSAFRRTGTGPA
jgi:hypothetical protein